MKYISVLFTLFLLWAIQGIAMEQPKTPVTAAVSSTFSGMSLEQIQKDAGKLKQLALAIFDRERDSERLQNKLCLHSVNILKFWSSTPMWNDMSTEERKSLNSPPEITSADWLRGLLRKDSLAFFHPDIFAKFKEFTISLIHEGTPILTESSGQQGRYTITIKHKFEKPLGIEYTKVIKEKKIEKVDEIPLFDLLLVVDVDDIIRAILLGKEPDMSRMGYISTICPTQR